MSDTEISHEIAETQAIDEHKKDLQTEQSTLPHTSDAGDDLTEFARFFNNCTGYSLTHFKSLTNFTEWLHRPVDAAALGLFRMCYGAAMLIDIAEERGGGQLDVRFGEPQHCHFPLLNSIKVASFPVMGCIYLCMWLGAIGIMLGYRFRLSCLAYISCYWYIFFLDKTAWNNHSYLFGLVGTMLLFTQANHYWSLDKYLNPTMDDTVPYWNYFLIKFQFFILYMYAGMKKLTTEWLSGYAMSSLSRHWLFVPFRLVLTAEMTDLLIVHWFTAFFDFTIAFLMTIEKTRLFATPFMVSFHLMNSRLFVIGMFPWVCLAQVPMFFGFSWPRKVNLIQLLYNPLKVKGKQQLAEYQETSIQQSKSSDCMQLQETNKKNTLRTLAVLMYCGLQLFLPYSHFITKGYNNWTNGLYGYSWDMMVHSYDTILASIKVVDNNNGRVHYLNPYVFTEYDRWTKYADMALQYAKCIEYNLIEDYARNPASSELTSNNISIYFDVWCSMNGRFQQRVFDPRVDLLKAKWSPFERTSWSLPLLNELNHMRPKLQKITEEVLAWNNYSDVIFVADFPGLTLDSFISPDLINVSLTILEGNVRYESEDDDKPYFLTAGKTFTLKSGIKHYVTTIGLKPSCYLYTYVNKTMADKNIIIDYENSNNQISYDNIDSNNPNGNDIGNGQSKQRDLLPLRKEFHDRVVNYKRFLNHMANCLLYLIYNVPIPMNVRDRNLE